jgi:hypothetical protein
MQVAWPGVGFRWLEVADPYRENEVREAPAADRGGTTEAEVAPGAVVTLTGVPLGSLPAGFRFE